MFGVVQDATANPKARRKAALKIAECLLPKVGKKAKVLPDEYGFSINPNLASAYRDIQLELRALVNEPTRKIPAIAEKIKKLEARVGIEPTHKGFADLSLTTWVPRLEWAYFCPVEL